MYFRIFLVVTAILFICMPKTELLTLRKKWHLSLFLWASRLRAPLFGGLFHKTTDLLRKFKKRFFLSIKER